MYLYLLDLPANQLLVVWHDGRYDHLRAASVCVLQEGFYLNPAWPSLTAYWTQVNQPPTIYQMANGLHHETLPLLLLQKCIKMYQNGLNLTGWKWSTILSETLNVSWKLTSMSKNSSFARKLKTLLLFTGRSKFMLAATWWFVTSPKYRVKKHQWRQVMDKKNNYAIVQADWNLLQNISPNGPELLWNFGK